MSPKQWMRAVPATALPGADDKPNMAKRHGFKESREEREAREAQEKQNKWEERLQKEDLGKLQAEFDSLSRARFLAPQQKTRKNLVEKMLRDLSKSNKKDDTDSGAANDGENSGAPESVPRASRGDNDDDEGVDILRDIVEAETLNTSQMQFVPRKVARRQDSTVAHKIGTPADQATEEEEKLLKAMADHPDDFDDILDSI